jgi:hypothetical protein
MAQDLLIERGAELSECGRYRYVLWRRWDKTRPRLGFIMLNPSTADAEVDDATIRVCMGRAFRMRYGGIRVVNLFPFRATHPADLKQAADTGIRHARQEFWLTMALDNSFRDVAVAPPPMLIAAWGDDGAYQGAARRALSLICYDYGEPLHHLGLTKAGHPKHPLRIPYATVPTLWIAGRNDYLRRLPS